MAGTGPLIDVHLTIGALFIGLFISCFLFGILTLQTYLYSINFPDDRRGVKALVTIVWLCELAHCVCVCHTVYHLAITGYGNPSFLVKAPASLSLAIAFSGIIGPFVQIFFAERVRIISGGRLLIPIFCWTVSVMRLGMSMAATVEALKMTSLAKFQAQWKWLLTTVLSIGVADDVVIAGALCYYLTERKTNSIKRTAQMLDKIIVWTVETGLITSIASVVMIICFLAMPGNFIWLAIFTFLARLYSNSLLASLNSRIILRGQSSIIDSTMIPARPHHPTTSTTAPSHNGSSQQHVLIRMTKLQEISSSEDTKIGKSSAGTAV